METHSAEIGKYVIVALLASSKFLFSPFAAQGFHLTFWQSLIATTAGGMAGIVVYGLIGELISAKWTLLLALGLCVFTRRNWAAAKKHAHRKFKPANRFIVRVKHRLGLFGLAFLTPCVISIPVGAIACMSFFSHRRKDVFLYLFASLVLWALILNIGAYVFKLSRLFS
jgi:hypothetical protein